MELLDEGVLHSRDSLLDAEGDGGEDGPVHWSLDLGRGGNGTSSVTIPHAVWAGVKYIMPLKRDERRADGRSVGAMPTGRSHAIAAMDDE